MNKAKHESGKPNVLIVMTDQHRADMMTCAGRDEVPTPNIDRIAARGIRFTNAYCPYPVCLASRSSLLTGLYPHNTGAITNEDRLDWRYRTMANHFSDHGYLTGLIGKMHFNDAHNHGFEYYLSINDWIMYLGPEVYKYANEIASHPLTLDFLNTVVDGGAGFPDVSGLWEGSSPWVGNVRRFDFATRKIMASEIEPEDQLDMFIAQESAKFMRRYREQPFFLVASFMKPHTPLFAPKEFADLYPIDDMVLPPVGNIEAYPKHIQRRIEGFKNSSHRCKQAHIAGYRANLAFSDRCIGYLLDALEGLNLLEDTIVVYTSDHGEMGGDHGLYQKFCMFEPSTKVPLIVSYPKALPVNRVTEALTESFGIYPTLTELTKTTLSNKTSLADMPDPPESIDAKSFADILYNPDLSGPDAVYSEYALRSPISSYMIRKKRYKYVFHHGSTHELYDLESDPKENINLINDARMDKVIKELRDQLFDWYNPESNLYRG